MGNAEASVVYINFKEIKLIVLQFNESTRNIIQTNKQSAAFLWAPHIFRYTDSFCTISTGFGFVFKNLPLENLNTLFFSLQTLSISHAWICHMQDHRFYSAAINTDTWISKKFPGLESTKINCPKVIYLFKNSTTLSYSRSITRHLYLVVLH